VFDLPCLLLTSFMSIPQKVAMGEILGPGPSKWN